MKKLITIAVGTLSSLLGLSAAHAPEANASWRYVHSLRCSLDRAGSDPIGNGYYTIVNGAMATGVDGAGDGGLGTDYSFFFCPIPEGGDFMGKDVNYTGLTAIDESTTKAISFKACGKIDSGAYSCGAAVSTGNAATGASTITLTDFSAWTEPGLGIAKRRYTFITVPQQQSGASTFSRFVNLSYSTP